MKQQEVSFHLHRILSIYHINATDRTLCLRPPCAIHCNHHDGVVCTPTRRAAHTYRGIVLGVER